MSMRFNLINSLSLWTWVITNIFGPSIPPKPFRLSLTIVTWLEMAKLRPIFIFGNLEGECFIQNCFLCVGGRDMCILTIDKLISRGKLWWMVVSYVRGRWTLTTISCFLGVCFRTSYAPWHTKYWWFVARWLV